MSVLAGVLLSLLFPLLKTKADDDSKTEKPTAGLAGRQRQRTSRSRPNLNGTREGTTRALQEAYVARYGIPSRIRDREEVNFFLIQQKDALLFEYTLCPSQKRYEARYESAGAACS